MNIKDDVSHIVDRKLSEYKDILCYPSKEPNSISIPKDFIESFEEGVEEKSPENCIYHIKLIDELLEYYKKEDIVIYSNSYKGKFNSEKDFYTLNGNFGVNNIYDICKPVSLINIEISVLPKNKNFSFSIQYLFDEDSIQLPRIQFYIWWRFECLHYTFQGHTYIQEHTVSDYIYSDLLNPNKIPEIITSFIGINNILKSYFDNVFIENAKLKKMSNIVWTTLTTLIKNKIGDKVESFFGCFENKTLLLYFIRGDTKKFEIDVENCSSEDLNIIIKDIEKLVNLKN